MKRIIFLIVLVSFTGCYKHQIHINETTIQQLSKYNLEKPSPEIALFLFVKSSNGLIGRLNINTLYRIYNKQYNHSDNNFQEFVSNCLNQKETIENDTLVKRGVITFAIDKTIEDESIKFGITKIIEKYCIKINTGNFEIKKAFLNQEQLNSILYNAFINNYKVLLDDYMGKYVIIK